MTHDSYVKYQKPYVARRREARLCYWQGCKVVTKDENGKGYCYCDKHAEIKAQYNRDRYQAMLRAYKSQVRVTEEPTKPN